jgi:hypothetical protein
MADAHHRKKVAAQRYGSGLKKGGWIDKYHHANYKLYLKIWTSLVITASWQQSQQLLQAMPPQHFKMVALVQRYFKWRYQ